MADNPSESPSILIVGAGVFGLSTVLALISRPRYDHTHITILDSQTPVPFPASSNSSSSPLTASLDSSRIIRSDYNTPAYAELAASAQKLWRQGWGGEVNYHETGLVLVANDDDGGKGSAYVQGSLESVRKLEKENGLGLHSKSVEQLVNEASVRKAMTGSDGTNGSHGYVNWGSGWADASGAIAFIREHIAQLGLSRQKAGLGKLEWKTGQVKKLLFEKSPNGSTYAYTVSGVLLSNFETILSPLTILATGAWTPFLLDTRCHLTPTGQVLSYIQLTPSEAQRLRNMPVLLNMSTGMFVIPPTASGELKVARHGYGYRNPMTISNPEPSSQSALTPNEKIDISIPAPDSCTLPSEAIAACRTFISNLFPSLSNRPFTSTRICWYTDTPTGNFLIDYHPQHAGLFIATGGSGHGYKFFPVLGEKIVDAIEGRLEPRLKELWEWKEGEGKGISGWETEDGTRGGKKGMIYEVEMAKGTISRL